MLFKQRIKFIKQTDSNDCGLACIAMLSTYFGVPANIRELKKISRIESTGISIENLIKVGGEAGLKLIPLRITKEQLLEDLPLPAVVYWNQNHFLLVERISKKYVHVVDPAVGPFRMPFEEFVDGWLINNRLGKQANHNVKGVLMLVDPLPEFGEKELNQAGNKRSNWGFVKDHFLVYKEDNLRIFLSLFVVSLLQLSLPFLNQLIVDTGVMGKNISFVYGVGIIIAVFYILISLNEFIRSWSLVYLGSRINYKLISYFLFKITKLPIATIYSKKIGDYVERINDHKRLETFFSESIIHSLFSIVTLFVYSTLLIYFSVDIFLVVIGLTAIELLWIFRFMGAIKTLDNKLFGVNALDQEKVYEILSNLPDIKLNTLEKSKNREWRTIQKKLFKINIAKLKLGQIEKGGSKIIASVQLVLVTVIAANLAAQGTITIGAMLSILFIVSQLNTPISQLINFLLQYQLIRNSFERILEIHDLKEESEEEGKVETVPQENLVLENLSFGYTPSVEILKDLNLTIPTNKTTAIVGYSGSGKTTLLKLLLKFYNNYGGKIAFEKSKLDFGELKAEAWRSQCGSVLQESSIYSETIAYNVALCENQEIDEKRLMHALEVACLYDFVNGLPLGVFTRLSSGGSSLSTGQKQRLLIARLVYKNPSFVFLDEATNALDANTEKNIISNLNDFFNGKTIVVVAHRLSTVKNADQIVVLEEGKIVETGSHSELIEAQQQYYHLVKNQLDLERRTV